MGLSALCGWAAYRIAAADTESTPFVAVFFGVVGPTAVFFLLVGYRLLFNRPNRYGSLLPPNGWLCLAFLFLACFAFVTILAVSASQYAFLSSAMPALAFAILSFRAFRSARERHAAAR